MEGKREDESTKPSKLENILKGKRRKEEDESNRESYSYSMTNDRSPESYRNKRYYSDSDSSSAYENSVDIEKLIQTKEFQAILLQNRYQYGEVQMSCCLVILIRCWLLINMGVIDGYEKVLMSIWWILVKRIQFYAFKTFLDIVSSSFTVSWLMNNLENELNTKES